MHRTDRTPNFDRHPVVPVAPAEVCAVGAEAVAQAIADAAASAGARVIALEAYPGVRRRDLEPILARLGAVTVIDAEEALLPPERIDALVQPDLTDDPVFGRLTRLALGDLFDPQAQARLRDQIAAEDGRVVVLGTGAALLTEGDLLVYANLPRWEIQQRQRAGEIANLGADNHGERASLTYKRAYFVDWRIADRHKRDLYDRIDLLLDTTRGSCPKLISGDDLRRGLSEAARRPFRVVPFFDPGPWGGQWMKQVCDLDRDEANYAWCFDCVPEENSLLLGFGHHRVEIPAVDLVLREPVALLGPDVRARFGDEFPIRFDLLDTVEGGNLSLQVHPVTRYIREQFGLHYTQDESYYLLDATEDARVYLGVRTGVDQDAMIDDLRRAQHGEQPFDAAAYVNVWPARRHDHFLIPAGTVHCSGAGGMVLEISATPYIFTFKLWDWDRLGLDGRPRPVHIDHGAANIQWHRDTGYVQRSCINVVEPLESDDGWRSERTGLHEAEFIDTHRHWFTRAVPHHTHGGVNVLNLVQGEEAVVESPDEAFDPFVVHYAETFIVPACVGAYTIRPYGTASGTECATIKAFVRGTDQRQGSWKNATGAAG